MSIHQTAIIDASAKLGRNVSVGPYTIIGPDVEIGDDCVIGPHVVIKGPTRIGVGNKIFQFASVGEDCQDLKYAGEPTRLEIGDHNIIRESVTIHRGTVQDEGVTRIGSHCLFMAYTHVAHDCVVGDRVILANTATLAGHVKVGSHVIIGGLSAVHQFCRIGDHAFIAGCSAIRQDVPPYVMANGDSPNGMNYEGLKRRGFSKAQLQNLRKAYKLIYRQGLTIDEAHAELSAMAETMEEIRPLADFLKLSERGIIR